MEFNRVNRKSLIIIIFSSIAFYLSIQNFDVVVQGFSYLFNLIFPFLLGGAIAFIFNVPMKKIESILFKKNKKKEKYKRPIAFLLTLLGMSLILLAGIFIIVPELINTGEILINQIPDAFANLETQMNQLNKQWAAFQTLQLDFQIDWDTIVKEIVSFVQDSVASLLNSTIAMVGNILSALATGIIGFTFSIYLLFQKEKLSLQIKKLCFAIFPKRVAKKIISIGKLSHTTFANFISGQCMESMILGFMFFIMMSIFQMPYALLIGVLIAITALIPVFGAFIGCVVGMFLILMVNPIQAVWFLILFLVLQQLEGNLIYPHVVGGKVGLPSFLVLVAVTVGGKVMGVAGMLIFIPISSIGYALLKDWMNETLEEKKITPNNYQE